MKKVLSVLLICALVLSLTACGKPEVTPQELLKGSMAAASEVKSRTDKVTVEFSTDNPEISMFTTGTVTAALELKTDTVKEVMSAVGSVKFGGMSFEMSMWATLLDVYFSNPMGDGYYTITREELTEYLGEENDPELFTKLKDEFVRFTTTSNVYSLFTLQDRKEKESITLGTAAPEEVRVVAWSISTAAAYKLVEEFIVFAQNSTVFADSVTASGDVTLEEYKEELQDALDEFKDLSDEDKAEFERLVANLNGVFYFGKDKNLLRTEVTFKYVEFVQDTYVESVEDKPETSTVKITMDTYNLNKTVTDTRPEVSSDLIIPLLDYFY